MVELADVFRQHGPVYRKEFGECMLPSHLAAMRDIEQCRTETLGGHVYRCLHCGEERYSYHSCKNRHCPKCQHDVAQAWLEKQQDLLLPVPYFLLTFTLPDGLRKLARSNQKLVYNLLFRASAEATQQLARDPRFVGGAIGMIGFLQTWTRDLTYHPHIHYLVPGGGLSPDHQQWLSSRNGFLVPVKALSILFRAKFRDALRKSNLFESVPSEVWSQDWVVHCQPVGNGAAALKYLAPYVFRVAISNRRILCLENGQVTFSYTDSKTGQQKTRTVTAEEFIRRFLQHVLPKGFMKVRYYGFFCSANRKTLHQIRRLLDCSPDDLEAEMDTELNRKPTPGMACPACGQVMQLVSTLRPRGRCPPEHMIG
jgi:hypothetical protein